MKEEYVGEIIQHVENFERFGFKKKKNIKEDIRYAFFFFECGIEFCAFISLDLQTSKSTPKMYCFIQKKLLLICMKCPICSPVSVN